MRIPLKNGSDFYMDNYLYENIQELKKLNKNGWDSLVLIVGDVGSGKTTIGVQIGTVLDSEFGMNNICFNGEQFEDKVMNNPTFFTIQIDEAIDGMDSKEHYKQINIRIHKLLAKMRIKHDYLIACMPRLKDFSEFSIQRASLMIKTYTRSKKRGKMYVYSKKRLKQLYYMDKGKVKHRKVAPNIKCSFTSQFGNVDFDAYERYKDDSFTSYFDKTSSSKKRDSDGEMKESILKLRKKGLTHREIGEVFNKSRSTIQDWLQKWDNSLEKSGF